MTRLIMVTTRATSSCPGCSFTSAEEMTLKICSDVACSTHMVSLSSTMKVAGCPDKCTHRKGHPFLYSYQDFVRLLCTTYCTAGNGGRICLPRGAFLFRLRILPADGPLNRVISLAVLLNHRDIPGAGRGVLAVQKKLGTDTGKEQ